MNSEIEKFVQKALEINKDLEAMLLTIKDLNGDAPTLPPPPDPPPDGDYSFPEGSHKTYTWRGDWGGRDVWIAGFLWKPHGDNTNKLVAILPGAIPPPDSTGDRCVRVWVADTKLRFIEELSYSGLANPLHDLGPHERSHWRSGKPGEAFPEKCFVVAEGSDGNRLLYPIANSAERNAGPISKSGQYKGDDKIHLTNVILWKAGEVNIPDPPNPPPPPGDSKLPAVLKKPRLWIWREGSKANDFGVKEAIVVATHGKAGAATVRIICMNGDPVVDVKSMVQRTHTAKAEGCAAVCIDLESHFIRRGVAHAQTVYQAVTNILPLIWAPKAFNDHMIKHWGFGSFEQGAKWLGIYGDGQIPWVYSKNNAREWIALHKKTIQAGNTDLYVPLGDFATRGDHTAFKGDVPSDFKAVGLSIGSFMPDSGQWTQMVVSGPAWKNSVEVYG